MKRIPFLPAALLLFLAVCCSEQIIEKTPVAHLLVSGTVLDETTGAPIEGVQVTMTNGYVNYGKLSPENPVCPPVLTDASGHYLIDYTGEPIIHAYIHFNDIDGPEHGGYHGDTFLTIWIDYSVTTMHSSGDVWDFGTIENKVETLYLNTVVPLP